MPISTPGTAWLPRCGCSIILLRTFPVSAWEVEKSGAGNWDDKEIESIAERLGFDLHISAEVYTGVKRPIRDDKGPLTLVKDLRNQLAHGSLSFTECGDGVTVRDLADLNRQAAGYLREVVAGFEQFINAHEFLAPERRPETGA